MNKGIFTSKGKSQLDFWQATTGAILVMFICVHLLLEGTSATNPSITNWIGWLLETTYVAQIAAPVLVLLILAHFIIAAKKMPFRASELVIYVRHSKTLKHADTWLWLVQVATALVILFFGFAHKCLPEETPASRPARHHAPHGLRRVRAQHPAQIRAEVPCREVRQGIGISSGRPSEWASRSPCFHSLHNQ